MPDRWISAWMKSSASFVIVKTSSGRPKPGYATKLCGQKHGREGETMMDDMSVEPANAVEIHSLTRRFGAKTALDNVSLTLPVGSVLGLVGENGAGKTTLIKHVLGLLRA